MRNFVITNPRWLACERALGREASAFEFSSWNRERWLEFEQHLLGHASKDSAIDSPRDRLVLAKERDIDARYDAWLLTRFPLESEVR